MAPSGGGLAPGGFRDGVRERRLGGRARPSGGHSGADSPASGEPIPMVPIPEGARPNNSLLAPKPVLVAPTGMRMPMTTSSTPGPGGDGSRGPNQNAYGDDNFLHTGTGGDDSRGPNQDAHASLITRIEMSRCSWFPTRDAHRRNNFFNARVGVSRFRWPPTGMPTPPSSPGARSAGSRRPTGIRTPPFSPKGERRRFTRPKPRCVRLPHHQGRGKTIHTAPNGMRTPPSSPRAREGDSRDPNRDAYASLITKGEGRRFTRPPTGMRTPPSSPRAREDDSRSRGYQPGCAPGYPRRPRRRAARRRVNLRRSLAARLRREFRSAGSPRPQSSTATRAPSERKRSTTRA